MLSTARIEYLGFLFDLTREGVSYVGEVDPVPPDAKAVLGELDITEKLRDFALWSVKNSFEGHPCYLPWEMIVEGFAECINAKILSVDDNEGPYPDDVLF